MEPKAPVHAGPDSRGDGKSHSSKINQARRGGNILEFTRRKNYSEDKEPADGTSKSLDHTDGLEGPFSGRGLSGRLSVPGEAGRDGPAAPGGTEASKAGGWSERAQVCVASRSLTINKPGMGLSLWAQCYPESPQCLSLKQSGKTDPQMH